MRPALRISVACPANRIFAARDVETKALGVRLVTRGQKKMIAGDCADFVSRSLFAQSATIMERSVWLLDFGLGWPGRSGLRF